MHKSTWPPPKKIKAILLKKERRRKSISTISTSKNTIWNFKKLINSKKQKNSIPFCPSNVGLKRQIPQMASNANLISAYTLFINAGQILDLTAPIYFIFIGGISFRKQKKKTTPIINVFHQMNVYFGFLDSGYSVGLERRLKVSTLSWQAWSKIFSPFKLFILYIYIYAWPRQNWG